MQLSPLGKEHLAEAAGLFVQNFKQLRQTAPALPDRMGNPAVVAEKLAHLLSFSSGLAALEGGRLVGYLSWFLVDGFRETDRRGAYCPEWGHGTDTEGRASIYRALYRAAAGQWAAASCQVYALSLLAHDRQAVDVWFWNGFGLTVVDAIRSIQPSGFSSPSGFMVRTAGEGDLQALSILDAEHVRHYREAPVFMVPPLSLDEAGWHSFLIEEPNSAWMAVDGESPVGFIRFDSKSHGAASIVEAETTIAITGAYIRPQYRGRGLALAVLDAALRHYSRQGFERCSVDFESFNPEAAAFWPRYFQPVCLSVTRIPEAGPSRTES